MWWLHPPQSIPAFKTRALSGALPLKARKKALAAIGFNTGSDAALAMLEIAEALGANPAATTPEAAVKDTALWWLLNRKDNVWKDHGLAAALKARGIYDPDKVTLSAVSLPDPPPAAFTVEEALKLTGDAKRGEGVSQRCYMCHRIGDNGAEFGPELTTWGHTQGTEVILRSLITPSADIAHGFEGVRLETTDDLLIDGLVLTEADPLIIRSMGGLTQTVPRAKIKSQKPLGRSLMMSATQLGLTAQLRGPGGVSAEIEGGEGVAWPCREAGQGGTVFPGWMRLSEGSRGRVPERTSGDPEIRIGDPGKPADKSMIARTGRDGLDPARLLTPTSPTDYMPRLRLPLLSFFLLPVSCLLAQTDDFDDNDDAGWTHLDQIGTITGSPFASIKVESGLYHLSSPASPNPGQMGPARAGAYRTDSTFTDFVIVVDIVSWDDSLDQAMGLLARIQPNPGPGSLKGYSLNYQPRDHDIEINRLDNEVPTLLTRMSVNLVPGDAHRFVLTGSGSTLSAAVFSQTDPLLPLVTLTTEDSTYSSGKGGIFIYNADSAGVGPADVTFDTYSASAPEIPVLSLRSITDAGPGPEAEAGVKVEWSRAASDWHLQFSTDLDVWADVTQGGELSAGILSYRATAGASGKGFYRLRQGWPATPEQRPSK